MMQVNPIAISLRALTTCAFLTGAMLAAGAAAAQNSPQPRLQTVDLRAGMHVIKAELAITPEQQMTGMMFRKEMNGNEGMLFVNDEKSSRCFWMRNTLVPLTIAFVADDGTIVNLADMQPLDETSHCSKAPVRFALEMPKGWFDKRGIKAGFKLNGPPFKNEGGPPK
jgi:uncharacterized membrane protein (UPF0127 family)